MSLGREPSHGASRAMNAPAQKLTAQPLPGVGRAAFGAGFTWGAGFINWKHCRHLTPSAD